MEAHLNFTAFSGRRLHLGVSGSIAAYKALDLLRAWQSIGLGISVTLTEAAKEFVTPLTFEALGAVPVYEHMFAPGKDPLAHLEPGTQAEVMIIAPAAATTLARLAGGSAEEMLYAQALAFTGPLVLAPAMNSRMWANTATQANWQTLLERGCVGITPGTGRMACQEVGEGRLADLRDIYLAALRCLSGQDFAGKRVLLTLGPTREFWDEVRFLSNPSSGIMGASLAVAAWLRGAEVTAVCGPGCPWLPQGIARIDVVSAQEMMDAAAEHFVDADYACFCAAVADFSPLEQQAGKVKKADLHKGIHLALQPTPDILATLAAKKHPKQRIIAFAAEAADLERHAMDKLNRKNADMLVGNLVNQPDSGFDGAKNTVSIWDRQGRHEQLPPLSKTEVAWRVWDWCLQL
jgi:phosphopantothenoylcysteine decarboxylase/phosphopantothenate--cysteine ligase